MNKGFTLVELVIAVAILVIVSGGVLYLIDPIGLAKRSRDSRRKADLEVIRQALELYRADEPNKYYPVTESYPGALEPSYISNVPEDPGGGNYSYARTSNSTYTLCATLEAETPANYCVQNP